MRIRAFEIENEKGQIFSLMDKQNYALLKEPSGLAYGYSREFSNLGYTYIETLRKIEQNVITGNLEFLSYDNFKLFVDFIEFSDKLKWKYIIPYKNETKTYYRDITLQNIDKGDIFTEGESLIVQATFNCLTLWYEENKTVYRIEPQTDEIRWDFKWDSKFADYNTRSMQYINNGHVDAPLEIVIDGEVVNPSILLYVEGELLQEVKINIKIEEFEKLLYGTRENNFYIMKQRGDGTRESLFSLDYINFENDNVIRIPVKKSCELKLTADNELLNAEITIYPSYKAI